MPAENTKGLMVRRTERREVALPALVCVAPQHTTTVRLARGSGHRDGWIEAGLVDLSTKGLGLITQVFLPRGSLVRIRLLQPGEGEASNVMVDCNAKVARVIMTDRRPGYLVGVSLVDNSEEQLRALADLIDRFAGELKNTVGGSSDA